MSARQSIQCWNLGRGFMGSLVDQNQVSCYLNFGLAVYLEFR